MPKSSSKRRTPYFFKNISNKSINFLANRVGNVGKIGSRAVKMSGRLVGVGTGVANRALGVGLSVGRNVTKRVRKSIKLRKYRR